MAQDTGERRRALIERLIDYNRRLGAPPRVLENIERLGSGSEGAQAVAVVSGQQPGLLGGPLYTIYKAISAIVLAERLGRTEGRPFVPIFWNHSEDHDFAEVGHIYLLREGRPVKLEYPPPEELAAGPRSVAELPLDPGQLERLLAQIEEATPQSEFSASILERVRELASCSRDFGEFFSRLMLWWFGEWGLVLVEPRTLRELMVPVFARLIEEPAATGRLVAQAGERLRREGRPPALRQPEHFCNFFVDRRRVLFRDGRFSIGVDGQTYSKEELLRLLEEEPERFSTDVVTRPLVQDWLLPTRAYVAGPNEAAYLAQLGEVYRWFSLRMPRVILRHRCTLIERRIKRILDRYAPWDVKLEDYREPERLAKRIAKAMSGLEEGFVRRREEIARILEGLKGELSKLDPQLERPCEAARAKIAKVLDQLEDKAAKAQREREPHLKEQIHRAASYLFPLGQPQERVLNIMEFLIRHGPSLLGWLKEQIARSEPGEHLLIELPPGERRGLG